MQTLIKKMSEVLTKRNYVKVEKLIVYLEETGYVEAQGSTNNSNYKVCMEKLNRE